MGSLCEGEARYKNEVCHYQEFGSHLCDEVRELGASVFHHPRKVAAKGNTSTTTRGSAAAITVRQKREEAEHPGEDHRHRRLHLVIRASR